MASKQASRLHTAKNTFEIQHQEVIAGVYKCINCSALHIQYLTKSLGKPQPHKIDVYCPACGERNHIYKQELKIADVLIEYRCMDCGHVTSKHQSCNQRDVTTCLSCKKLAPHDRRD